MTADRKAEKRFSNNPHRLSPHSVEIAMEAGRKEPFRMPEEWRSLGLGDTFGVEFQAFRMNSLGWGKSIPNEITSKYKLPAGAQIDSMGPDGWGRDNPELLQAISSLIEELSKNYATGTLKLYDKTYQIELLEELRPILTETWQDSLWGYALRAYAWLTPNPPELIPIPASKRSKATE